MQVRYSLTRGDMRRAVAGAWNKSLRFRLFLLAAALWPAAMYLFIGFTIGGSVGAQDFVFAAALGLLFGLLMPVLLIVRTKTSERVLSIDRSGIKTTIGQMRGEIPWSKVGAIETTDQQVLVIGTTPNLFAIPFRAFDQNDDRSKFCEAAREYWTAARMRAAV